MELIPIQNKIYEIRGQKVMLNFDLAEMYEVETKVSNQAVKRNIDRFPKDFMFRLTAKEWDNLRSQKHRPKSVIPFAFTEHGVMMLASVLRSKKAIQINIPIVRAFILLREYAYNYKELAARLRNWRSNITNTFRTFSGYWISC